MRKADPRRILIVQLGNGIGDVFNSTPAIRALRARYPAARLDALVTGTGARVLVGSPHLDRVLTFDKTLFDRVGASLSPRALLAGLRFALTLRRRRYDTLVLLHHLITPWGTRKYAVLALWSGAPVRVGLDNGRGWFLTHRAVDRGFGAVNERRYWLEVVGILGAAGNDDRPELAIGAAARRAGRALIETVRQKPDQPIVVLHAGSGAYGQSRQWPATRFAAVADRLAAARGAAIVLVGGPDAAETNAAVRGAMRAAPLDLTGRTPDLATLGGALLEADLVIANDSSVGHLAAALGTPTLSLFGPSNDAAWAPYGAARVILPADEHLIPPLPDGRAVIVRSADPHAPCLYVGYGPGNPGGCPGCRCLTAIDAHRVAVLATRILDRGCPTDESTH